MEPVVTAQQMRELDRTTIETLGIPGRVLMETAGRAVADCARTLKRGSGPVVVVCGTGNNGGDGYVAARALFAEGHRVQVWIVGERRKIKGDAAGALTTLERAGEASIHDAVDTFGLQRLAHALDDASVVVDALLGTGTRGPVRGGAAEAIRAINSASRPVVAVDIPSGVDSDTGQVLGRAVQALATVTFAFAKRGHYLHPGAQYRGILRVVDIGIPRRLLDAHAPSVEVVTPEDGPALFPPRPRDAHKGTFGRVVVAAGSPTMPGAAGLVLAGALRSGVGLVNWATDEVTVQRLPSRPPEVMLRLRSAAEDEAWTREALAGASALVVGPGWGSEATRRTELEAWLRSSSVPVCLDADALNLLAKDPVLWGERRSPWVVTPHPREIARLLETNVATVQGDRFVAALELARARDCVVVLKGAGTVVAEPDGSAAIVAAGGPGLASGGTGDVLAGVIGGLLAQGWNPADAARRGVLLHGCAGEAAATRHGEVGMHATDVVEALGTVLAQWRR